MIYSSSTRDRFLLWNRLIKRKVNKINFFLKCLFLKEFFSKRLCSGVYWNPGFYVGGCACYQTQVNWG